MNILNKLTLKNLKLNKSRTIVTVIGIMLSTALVTCVAGMMTSFQQTLIKSEEAYAGDYDVELNFATSAGLKKLKANRYVQEVYTGDYLGCAEIEGAKSKQKPYVCVKGYSKNSLGTCFDLQLTEGSYPKSSDEIVLSEDMLKKSDKEYKVGDSITLDLGVRVDEDGNELGYENSYGVYYNSEEPKEEHLENVQSKTFNIVGIAGTTSPYIGVDSYSACVSAFTVLDGNASRYAKVYVKYTPEGEKNYVAATASIMGVSEKEVNENIEAYYSNSFENANFSAFELHTTLLSYKGYSVSDLTMRMLLMIVGIIILIIVLTSVFVIRNSFAISITEKTKLYGMMSSIGATPRQIRKNVLFEGFVLGIIGIPLGLLLGVGVVAILINLLNFILGDMLNNMKLVYSVPLIPIAFSVIISAVTILFSTLSTAIRASKIPPITAIRSNKDIKLDKKQKKYKTPKLIKKLFGTGGDIAYKNLKRSRKKYRTTVISIVVSVAIFIAMATFMQYGQRYSSDYYSLKEFNVQLSQVDYSETAKKEFYAALELDGIESKAVISQMWCYADNMNLTSNVTSAFDAENSDFNTEEEYFTNLPVMALDNSSYKTLLNEYKLDYDEVKDKAIIFDNIAYFEKGVKKVGRVTDYKKGGSLEFHGVSETKKQSLEIAEILDESPKVMGMDLKDEYSIGVLISEEKIQEISSTYKSESSGVYRYAVIKAYDSYDYEQAIENMSFSSIHCNNIEDYVRQNNAVVLVISIFLYGFIAVISLIGVTNIFNTISTNMRLRSKEFAMLKSIGMTKREFNRMIRLESIFYGAKSLLIGIPLGLLGGFAFYYAFLQKNAMDYVFPFSAVLISIVFVFAVVWMIMKFSMSKIKKQNIIETIRNDNQ